MKRLVYISLLAVITSAHTAFACPSCYGAAKSPMIDGMNTAILTMLGITGFVLSAFGGMIIYFWRRWKRQQALVSPESFVDDNGTLHIIQGKGVVEWNNS